MSTREEKTTITKLYSAKSIYYAIGVIALLFGGMIIQSLSGLLPYSKEDDTDSDIGSISLLMSSNAKIKWTDGTIIIDEHPINGSIAITLIDHEILLSYYTIFEELATWYYNIDGFSDNSNFPNVQSFAGDPTFNTGQELKIKLLATDDISTITLGGDSVMRYDLYSVEFIFQNPTPLPKYGNQDDNNFITMNMKFTPQYIVEAIELIQQNIADNGGNPSPDEDVADFITDILLVSLNEYFETVKFDITKDNVEFELTDYIIDENGREYNSGDPNNDFHDDFNEYMYFNLNGISHVVSANMTVIS